MATTGRDAEEANTARQAKRLGFNYLDCRNLKQKPLYQDLISFYQVKQHRVVPIVTSDDEITFGITPQTQSETLEKLRFQYDQYNVRYIVISDSSLREYQQLYQPKDQVNYQDISIVDQDQDQQFQQINQILLQIKPEDLMAYIVSQAIRLKASDIHLENQPDWTLVRLRVIGLLHPIARLPKNHFRVLLSTIASAANLSTSSPKPQSGRISQTETMANDQQVEINLRVETITGSFGMDVVMRLFNFDLNTLNLKRLDFRDSQRQIINQIIAKPSGLVLLVGPTGCGKTTSLYAILNQLNNPQRKIITLEDPVECQLPGVIQIPINSQAGDSFKAGLKSVLRLDPDVLMVGEIRDDDTAKTALQAALTGHLVLSTYHAPSAKTALIRLLDSMTNNPLLLNALRLVVAQRLVRRLDPKTKEAYRPNDQEIEKLKGVVDNLPAGNQIDVDWNKLQLYQPSNGLFGFNDRLAIRETLVIDDQLKEDLIDSDLVTSTQKLRQFGAGSEHMPNLLEDGVLRVLEGKTSLLEIERVLD